MLRINQKAKKYGTTRSNMSKVTTEEVRMHCKAVTTNLFTVVGLIVETSIAIRKKSVLLRQLFPLVNPPLQ